MGYLSILGEAIKDSNSTKWTLGFYFLAAAAASAIDGGVSATTVIAPAVPMVLPKLILGVLNTTPSPE